MTNTDEGATPTEVITMLILAVILIPTILTLTMLGISYANHAAEGWEIERQQELDEKHEAEYRERMEFTEKNPIR